MQNHASPRHNKGDLALRQVPSSSGLPTMAELELKPPSAEG